jgi:hypothetical protein
MALTTYTTSVPAGNVIGILVAAVPRPTLVTVTCGFGVATVAVSCRENGEDSTWVQLPALGVPWTKKLGQGEMLFVRSDLAVRVPIVLAEA